VAFAAAVVESIDRMKLVRLFRAWFGLPPSRRRQWLGFLRDLLWTRVVYARRLKACGRGVIVQKPLFWTPEFIELGQSVHLWPGSRFEGVDSYGDQMFAPCLRIGDRTSFQQNCHVTFAGSLEIGAGCAIMFGALITDVDHCYADIEVRVLAQPILIGTTRIGRNCFIGAGAKIQAGTVLGDHCIVGANAVVRGHFPDHCVIAGVPARILKLRDPETGRWETPDPKKDATA